MILIIFMLLLDFYIQDGLLLPGVEEKKVETTYFSNIVCGEPGSAGSFFPLKGVFSPHCRQSACW